MRLLSQLTAVVLLCAAGCTTHNPAPDAREKEPPATQPINVLGGRKMVPQPPATTLLSAGTLPMVYQFGAGGSVRLFDTTARQAVWTGVVSPGALIAVDDNGVRVSSDRAVSRKLDPSHRYELWWEPK